jgi:hypothetical protein
MQSKTSVPIAAIRRLQAESREIHLDQLTVDQVPSGLRQAVPRSICGLASM